MSDAAIEQHIAIFVCLACIWVVLVFLGLSMFMVNRPLDDDSDLHS